MGAAGMVCLLRFVLSAMLLCCRPTGRQVLEQHQLQCYLRMRSQQHQPSLPLQQRPGSVPSSRPMQAAATSPRGHTLRALQQLRHWRATHHHQPPGYQRQHKGYSRYAVQLVQHRRLQPDCLSEPVNSCNCQLPWKPRLAGWRCLCKAW
jgi:hypothetical protein